jgi:superfamily II DNA or RNA helicase
LRLREWQNKAIKAALKKFETPFSHFLLLATPGSGKTVMASTLADILIKEDKVDLVLCFSPSKVVANDFKVELEAITKKRFCGGLGAKGSSLTYQSMRHLDETFWTLLDTYRVFVIFDEIHHCAGNGIENANAWGAQILKNIQGKALYTIALTGTPWRSDTVPIALASYVGENSLISVDYKYDLNQAIKDGVCRAPHTTLLDNELISVIGDNEGNTFTSIAQFLDQSGLSYLELIAHDEVIRQILSQGITRLNKERGLASDAGGLIVSASVSHAKQIQRLLHELGEPSELVTYQENDPESLIQKFKHSTQKWIISIGMISEGTNIPRLRVCCYLSLVTTELYFRQVLGRVLRAQYSTTETGYLVMPAHPRLLEFANRLAEEVPHYAVLDSSNRDDRNKSDTTNESEKNTGNTKGGETKEGQTNSPEIQIGDEPDQGPLNNWYNSTIDSFGRFHQKVFKL